jgi:hypothetical protein
MVVPFGDALGPPLELELLDELLPDELPDELDAPLLPLLLLEEDEDEAPDEDDEETPELDDELVELPDEEELEPLLEEDDDPPLDELELDELPPDELLEEAIDDWVESDTATTVMPVESVTEAPPINSCGVTRSSNVNSPVAVSPLRTAALSPQLE